MMNDAPQQKRDEAASREKVLANIRNALIGAQANPYPETPPDAAWVGIPEEDDGAVQFAVKLSENGGHFVYCSDEDEFLRLLFIAMKEANLPPPLPCSQNLTDLLTDARIPFETIPESDSACVLLDCEALDASTGGVVFSCDIERVLHSKVFLIRAYTPQLQVSRRMAWKTVAEKYGAELPPYLSELDGSFVNKTEGKALYVFLIDNTEFDD